MIIAILYWIMTTKLEMNTLQTSCTQTREDFMSPLKKDEKKSQILLLVVYGARPAQNHAFQKKNTTFRE